MNLHIVTHESFEAPAAIESWAKAKGHGIGYTRLHQGDSFPENDEDFDFLVVMGGPQSPATTLNECPYFDASAEIAFIKQAIDNGKSALGVCLGAQMIGEALGAAFDHSPHREIGVFPLILTEDGEKDPFFGNFSETFDVGHWHGDMPGLTAESKVLAVSEGCPRQIVRYRPNVYGFQCHFEFTPEAIEGMIQNSAHELEQYKGFSYIETSEQLRAHDFTNINAMLFRFLDYIASLPKAI
jgi:GMP synthase (glutamine-hydrolysing)